MLCEIVNPSDKYTLECSDFLVGAVAVAILGNGRYGLTSEDGEQSSPVLFGWSEWLKEQGIEDVNDYIKKNKTALATCLESVMIGGMDIRRSEQAATKYMTDDDAKKYRAELHDQRRTSLNDIGKRAWALAEALRGKKVEVPEDRSIILVGP